MTTSNFHSYSSIRQQATDLFAKDGELEIDADAPVSITDDTASVGCWTWVSNDSAGISDNDQHSDGEREALYEAAANSVSTPAEFKDDIKTSLGDEEGSYVFGWVTFGLTDLPQNPLLLIDGSEEDIDKWLNAADHYSVASHTCPACELLENMDDACDFLRDCFMNADHPRTAVKKLFQHQAEVLWQCLGDIPVIESDRIGAEFKTPTITFGKGTPVLSIWKWFEHHYDLSVACDLMKLNAQAA